MFVRNVLHAGDFVTVVPLGLPLTLQYNENGKLEKVYAGYEDDKVNVSSEILHTLAVNRTVPIRIPSTGGTTWVIGVLYSAHTAYSAGSLPEVIYDDIMHQYNATPSNYQFYAGAVNSYGAVFNGAPATRNWLTLCKFNVLPGYIMPYKITKDTLLNMFRTSKFPFQVPLIMSYIVYRGADVLYVSTNLKQFTVSKVVRYVDENGDIKGKLYTKSSPSSISVDYSDIVNYNIHTNSVVVLDCYNSIIYSASTDTKKRERRSSEISCSVCGKLIRVPASGAVTCRDTHCVSRLYPIVSNMLAKLCLPEISYTRYSEAVQSKQILSAPDVLLLEEYRELDLSVTIPQLLSAIVPVDVVANELLFTSFANKCKNNIRTVQYYIQHPEQISTDLKVADLYTRRFIEWLTDPCNVSDLTALIDNPHIKFVDSNKQFNGPEIFRNKTILITGKFRHGSSDDISAILRSYAASVAYSFSSEVDCVLVGDILENIDGVAIKSAASQRVPVFSESEFFAKYEIDSDLATNL